MTVFFFYNDYGGYSGFSFYFILSTQRIDGKISVNVKNIILCLIKSQIEKNVFSPLCEALYSHFVS